jgi:hypothetical protein
LRSKLTASDPKSVAGIVPIDPLLNTAFHAVIGIVAALGPLRVAGVVMVTSTF